jgi:hypothetical protein
LFLRSSLSATSECGDDPELSCVAELKNPVLDASGDENMESALPVDSKEPSSGISEDEGVMKEVVQLMESSSGLGEKGGEDQPTTVVVDSNKPLSGSIGEKEDGAREIDDLMKSSSGLDEEGDEDHPMVGVMSKEVLSGLQEEGDDDQPMVGVESKEAASESEEEGDEDRPVVAIDSKKALSKEAASALEEGEYQPMVAVNSKKALSDMMEVDGESQPPVEVNAKKSVDSLEDSTEAGPIMDIVESGSSKKSQTAGRIQTKPTKPSQKDLKILKEFLNSTSDLESDSLDEVAVPLEVRRSSRLANSKNNATLKIARPRGRKSSIAKRKLAQKKDDIHDVLLQASIPVYSSRTISLNGI